MKWKITSQQTPVSGRNFITLHPADGYAGLVVLKNKFGLNAANCRVCVLFGFVRERQKAEKHRCEKGVHGGEGGQRQTKFRNFYELQSNILFIAIKPLLDEFFISNILFASTLFFFLVTPIFSKLIVRINLWCKNVCIRKWQCCDISNIRTPGERSQIILRNACY
jgi:hypothetical protein